MKSRRFVLSSQPTNRAISTFRTIVALPIIGYQSVSKYMPRRCKYEPTCSVYAVDSIKTNGVFVGIAASIWRLVRCNPFSNGGLDPVVKRKEK